MKLKLHIAIMLCLALIPAISHAGILEDFLFNDVSGTTLGGAANTANPGNLWAESVQMTNTTIQGGVLRVQKDNASFGSNGLDITDVTSGTVWLVADFAGWNITGNVIGSDREEIRFTFLDNASHDPPGSTITAQVELERIDTDNGTTPGRLEINGAALGSGSGISPATLNLNQPDPFSVVMELDKDANQYSIFYRDGANDFVQLGTGAVDPARNGNTVRMVYNNNFGDGAGEFVDLDRFYITDVNPIKGSFDLLSIEVNTTTGQTKIINDSATTDFDIDLYRISSGSDSLNPVGWNSLDDQNFDAIGAGVGESWDEAGGSDSGVLAESYLLSSSVFAPGADVGIGAAFASGGSQDLVFQYRDSATGNVFEGTVNYVMGGINGDFDGNGAWDCADVDALVAEIAAGTNDPGFDMNGDGSVDINDLNGPGTGWLAVGGANNPADTGGNAFLAGDANLDGSVDVSDFNLWNSNKFSSTAEWCSGDFNADGSIDVSDFNIWNGNKFQSSDVAMVPEPASLTLLFTALAGLVWTRRK